MTRLHKAVTRRTHGTVFERGKERDIIVTLRPPNVIAFKLAGLRTEHTLTVEACYWQAVKATAESIKAVRKVRTVKRGVV